MQKGSWAVNTVRLSRGTCSDTQIIISSSVWTRGSKKNVFVETLENLMLTCFWDPRCVRPQDWFDVVSGTVVWLFRTFCSSSETNERPHELGSLINLQHLVKACDWLSEADFQQEGSDLHWPQGHLPCGGVFKGLQQGPLFWKKQLKLTIFFTQMSRCHPGNIQQWVN